ARQGEWRDGGGRDSRRGVNGQPVTFGCDWNLPGSVDILPFLATPKRDSSTARPDPEIDTTDLREGIRRRDASLRMTCGEGVKEQGRRFRLKFEDVNRATERPSYLRSEFQPRQMRFTPGS